jgi:N-acetylglucosaminyldiphosphoundecaprenol N-acetyl-beta-D-mannosaminyltransferase
MTLGLEISSGSETPRNLDIAAVSFLGIAVHPVTWKDLKRVICYSVERKHGWIIAHHNLHSTYFYHHDAGVRDFYSRSSWTHIDGMSLVFFGRLLGLPLYRTHRQTHLDWIRPLLAEAARRGWRVFYLGSRPGVAAHGAELLRREFPTLALETAHGYFDAQRESTENQAVIEAINRFRPDLLLVGMGMPRQERWILDNRDALDAGVIFNVGGLMDYIAGATATPPRWMGRLGFEWLFRLLSDPARLWRRYLVEPWFIMRIFVIELLRKKMGRLSETP